MLYLLPVFIGLVGQGGAFIIIPILLYVLKIPLRVTIGSTLAIGTAGLIGKIATGQVPFQIAIALLMGSIPAAQLGSVIGRKTKVQFLRWLLAFIITVSAIKVWSDIFWPK